MSLLVQWDKQAKNELHKYLIAENRIERVARIPWKGNNLIDFPVYRVPTKLLSYNFNNTRIRSELEGFLHKTNQTPDPKNEQHITKVHDILLHSKWFGDIRTEKLSTDIIERGQLDPAVARPDGILIDGNRRLAILRKLESETNSRTFSTMDICVLDELATESDLKALEMRLQMTQSFRVRYGEINTALEFRHLHRNLHWTLDEIEEITGKYYKKKKVLDMISIIDLIDECLSILPPKGAHIKQYTELEKGWEGFANLWNIIKSIKKTEPNEIKRHEKIKLLGFQIIVSPNTTYVDVRKLGRILKLSESKNELERLSSTLRNNVTENALNLDVIDREMDYLDAAYAIWDENHESPITKVNDILKKLNQIRLHKTKESQTELLSILDKIIDRANHLKKIAK